MKRIEVYTPIHEVQEHRHRIIVLRADGTNESGDWFNSTEIASHPAGLFAVASASPLPPGIFRVREVAHQVLA